MLSFKKSKRRSMLLAILSLIGLAITLSSCKYSYNQDNVAEEAIEEAIEYKYGVDVDLSPQTPEKGFSPKKLMPFQKK